MVILKKMISRHIVYCPRCGEELNFYALSSSDTTTFKCLKCNKYFDRARNSTELVESDAQEKHNEIIRQYDEYHDYYQGMPSSEAYKPWWVGILGKILRRK